MSESVVDTSSGDMLNMDKSTLLDLKMRFAFLTIEYHINWRSSEESSTVYRFESMKKYRRESESLLKAMALLDSKISIAWDDLPTSIRSHTIETVMTLAAMRLYNSLITFKKSQRRSYDFSVLRTASDAFMPARHLHSVYLFEEGDGLTDMQTLVVESEDCFMEISSILNGRFS